MHGPPYVVPVGTFSSLAPPGTFCNVTISMDLLIFEEHLLNGQFNEIFLLHFLTKQLFRVLIDMLERDFEFC
jgi:hypothetical protein